MKTNAVLTSVRLEDIPPQTKRTSPNQVANSVQESVRDADQKTQRDDLEQMVQQINQEYAVRNISLKFSIDEESGSLVIKVLDMANEKIIRQIPAESILEIRRRMSALLGEIFDAEA